MAADGSGSVTTVPTTGVAFNSPTGIAIDNVSDRIYWGDLPNMIGYLDLATGVNHELEIEGATVSAPYGISVDPIGHQIYWVNSSNNPISSAGLDGENASDLAINPATYDSPGYPIILRKPISLESPSVSVTGQQLSCSTGTWAEDQPESFFFAAPTETSISWLMDGEPVEGATGATLEATESGSYSCVQSAGNTSGEATATSASVDVVVTVTCPAVAVRKLNSQAAKKGRRPIKIKVSTSGPATVKAGGKATYRKRGRKHVVKLKMAKVEVEGESAVLKLKPNRKLPGGVTLKVQLKAQTKPVAENCESTYGEARTFRIKVRVRG